jgi:hypothetical protein
VNKSTQHSAVSTQPDGLNPEYPVFANTRPWNELILRGVRKFKTISFPWKYRGLIYLYDTKGKGDADGVDWAEDRGVEISMEFGFPGCIVGTVEVYDSRTYPQTETGAQHEILLRNPQRMDAVQFKWPNRGPGRIAKISAAQRSGQ